MTDKRTLFEFSLNVFTEFSEFSDKNICHYSKRARTCHPATSCVRNQDATTMPVKHMWETESLNWLQFMLQWFLRVPEFAEFAEFLFHIGKTRLLWRWRSISINVNSMSNFSVLFRPHTKKKNLFSSCGLGKRCYFLQYSTGFLLVRKDKGYVYLANDQEISISPVAHLSDLSNGNKFVFYMILVENMSIFTNRSFETSYFSFCYIGKIFTKTSA